ncbi:Uncharacterised protein [Mycobacteroides abscessus subsp. abscessus]|nr:Uncharacterised protein [Mycobacteroides abscessus subsp. abscessus]
MSLAEHGHEPFAPIAKCLTFEDLNWAADTRHCFLKSFALDRGRHAVFELGVLHELAHQIGVVGQDQGMYR